MAENLDSIDAIPPIRVEDVAFDRAAIQAEKLLEAGFDQSFIQMFPDGAGYSSEVDVLSEFGRGGSSEVDEVRAGLVSDAERPGLAPKSGMVDDSSSGQMIEMANTINRTMINFNVAWGLLSGLRRDLQQLLRGQ